MINRLSIILTTPYHHGYEIVYADDPCSAVWIGQNETICQVLAWTYGDTFGISCLFHGFSFPFFELVLVGILSAFKGTLEHWLYQYSNAPSKDGADWFNRRIRSVR